MIPNYGRVWDEEYCLAGHFGGLTLQALHDNHDDSPYYANFSLFSSGGGGGGGGGGGVSSMTSTGTPNPQQGNTPQNLQYTEGTGHEVSTEAQHGLVSSTLVSSAHTEPSAVLGAHTAGQRTEDESEAQNVHEDGEATNSTHIWPVVHGSMESLFCIYWYLDPLSFNPIVNRGYVRCVEGAFKEFSKLLYDDFFLVIQIG